MRCDSDDEIVPIVSGRQKKGFTPVSGGWHRGGAAPLALARQRRAQHLSQLLPSLRLAARARAPTSPLSALFGSPPQKEYQQLRNPKLMGGATIGEELGEPRAVLCPVRMQAVCARLSGLPPAPPSPACCPNARASTGRHVGSPASATTCTPCTARAACSHHPGKVSGSRAGRRDKVRSAEIGQLVRYCGGDMLGRMLFARKALWKGGGGWGVQGRGRQKRCPAGHALASAGAALAVAMERGTWLPLPASLCPGSCSEGWSSLQPCGW